MQEEKVLVPQLRFSEFDREWSNYKLGDVCQKIQDGNYGGSYPKSNEFVDVGIPFLTSKALGGNGVLKENKVDFISLEKHKELKKAHLKLNDVLFTNRGSNVGSIGFVDKRISNGNIGPQLTLLRSNRDRIEPLFLYQIMTSFSIIKQVRSQDSGSAMNFFGITATSKFKVVIPQQEEQRKIANFLTTIDNQIQTLEKKKSLLEQYKKGVMQQLFKQELRFKDEDGNDFADWEVKKLGEYLIQFNEKSEYSDQYPVLTSSRKGIMFQTEYFSGNQVASKDNTGYNVVPRNYFTYRHMSDDLIFKFNKNTICDKGIVSTLYPVFSTKNIDNKFLEYKLNEGFEIKRYALLQKQGGSRTYLYFKKLANMNLNMPCVKEQIKIANFLLAIDKNIDLVSTKIEQTKTYKKGLLQQMFV
ncbi:restriction endonuclease subunit S [Polaribacter sp. IC073]|uniref:restriction endonuclease subunit S n=1 Tax=Polaribacter sp. IC073 TaxID=2508540 RepID=UPI0011BDA1DA|nr:restriction endonuclease subunit S [Polaribacter sp. IC073]TXD48675.1 restriction endonuclease subunit S [Polaribacter sp. IC073]